MSLVSQIASLATRIATEFNTLRSEVSNVASGNLPTGGTTGQILSKIDATDYNTTWIDNYADKLYVYVKNESGAAMTKGQAVYIAGTETSANYPRVLLADADTEATSSKTVGLLLQDLAINAYGYIVCEGLLEGIDTSAATAGTSVWLSSTAGGRVYGAPPAKPAHSVYLGVVIRSNGSTGKIQVKVQNGYESTELHDWAATSATDGQVPIWNASTGLWTPGAPPVPAAFYVSETAPTGSSLKNGDGWFNSTSGRIFVRYNSAWVEPTPMPQVAPEVISPFLLGV